ncbi:uncharacterized protein LOC130826542 [Amaranthus tricolor]|uniref:uncharacterized protein LOC130826542 n=1 Tax=Amaranthus tricolor TaxID=29722 RepID=UPI00258AAD6A|nr:uncharacterized protein LOC130826542 [Amaranthus tricolor]
MLNAMDDLLAATKRASRILAMMVGKVKVALFCDQHNIPLSEMNIKHHLLTWYHSTLRSSRPKLLLLPHRIHLLPLQYFMADTPKYHPAFAITNVKSLIPITLDTAGMYHSWAALFKVLCRVHDLTNHIIPPTDATELSAYENLKSADLVYWKRLDAAVLNWIYGSISPDLLTAILLKDDTAQSAWARLESMFQDNKASRASHLEQELADLDFDNFSSIDGYCNHIKSLADRLANVDAPIPDTRLILKLTAGLPEAYAGTVDFIQNQEPLPSFESCRSRLKLAERTIKNRLAKEGGSHGRSPTALVSTTGKNHSDSSASRYNMNSKQKKKPSKPFNKAAQNFSGPAQQQNNFNGQPWLFQQRPNS